MHILNHISELTLGSQYFYLESPDFQQSLMHHRMRAWVTKDAQILADRKGLKK